eukprot:CAMPEP_0172445272 /NCGR_PEP_ID=MMETSP1065-20121228/5140_1 /TAXON_ID=265537 /ORGANISM="Amphiprora paludosa, Strain CCMP125" /LENGTH=287 /DNA_ID=CAMNT_0013196071 /DNA_START=99 /DNA_END=962 /DNA_ORIENTATION=-
MLRFNLAQSEYIPSTFASKNECRPLWYNPEELGSFRKELMNAAQRVSRQSNGKTCRRTIYSLYQCCGSNQPSQSHNLTTAQKSALVQVYYRLAEEEESFVGLEQLVSVKRTDRVRRRHACLQAIRSIQEGPHEDLLGFAVEELIRKKCLKITQPARLFATHLAMAKSVAIKIAQASSNNSQQDNVVSAPKSRKRSIRTSIALFDDEDDLPARPLLVKQKAFCVKKTTAEISSKPFFQQVRSFKTTGGQLYFLAPQKTDNNKKNTKRRHTFIPFMTSPNAHLAVSRAA